MNILKKLSPIIFLFALLTVGNICSAQRISVYDSTIDNFCERYNSIVKSLPNKNSILIEKSSMQKKSVNGGTLFFYSLRNVVNGNGTHIVFFITPSNNIFEINITNSMNATKIDTQYAYMTVLKTLGLNKDDIYFFSELSEPKYKPISSKRTLVVGFRPAGPKIGLDEYKIAAFDN